MRWPSRRGSKGLGADSAAPAPPSPTPSSTPRSPGERAWKSLAPIAPTWSAQTPLTAPAAAPARSLLTQEPGRRSSAASSDGAPEPGRVIGLAAVVAPTAPEPVAELPSYFRDQPPLRHVTAKPVTEHAALTQASSEYVGEPLLAAPPPLTAASLFPEQTVRPAEPPVEARTEAGARFREALANLHSSGLPEYVSPGEAQRPDASAGSTPPRPPLPPHLPPAPAEPPLATYDQSGAPLTHRRNSLAESRRLGLGAPMRAIPGSEDPPVAADPPTEAPPPPVPPTGAALAALPAGVPTGPAIPPAAARPPSAEPSPTDEGDSRGAPSHRSPLTALPTVRPITDGTARPSSSTAPLVFRSTARDNAAPATPATPRPPERAEVTRAPAELARALRASHGIDIGDVPIRRDADVDAEAGRRRARAFTRGATVHLPDAAGPITSQNARALLAHELVHAAQQRRLGGSLPGEHSTEGRVLEAEALAAEAAYGGTPADLTSTDPLRHAPAPVTPSWVDDRITQHATYTKPGVSPYPLTEEQIQAVQYEAAEVIKASGGATGEGGGGASFAGKLDDPSAGSVGARTIKEFQDAILARYNIERELRGMPKLDKLDSDSAALAGTEWKAAEAERKAALEHEDKIKAAADVRKKEAKAKANELVDKEKAEQEKADKQKAALAGLTWTPATGFKKGSRSAEADAALGALAASGALTDVDVDGGEDAGDEGEGTPPKLGASRSGAARPKEPTKVAAWEVDLLDPDPEVTGFKVRTADEFEAATLAQYNIERQVNGMKPLGAFPPDQQDKLRTQFAAVREATVRKNLEVAQRKDAARRQKEAAQDKATAEAAAKRATATNTATTAALMTAVAATADQDDAPATTPATPAARVIRSAGAHQDDELAGTDLEELTDRIYDRLRRKLRTELIVDRERAGLLTDFR